MDEIFISYKSERRRAAEHLAEVCRRHGYSVWFDYHLIKGDDFDFQLDAKLVAAKAVIVLWCTQSVESKWVSREATKAAQRGTLLPILIEDCDLKTAHVNSDCIDLRAWDGSIRSHALDPLFDALEVKVGRGPVAELKGVREYDETWRRFGAPTLSAFALDGPSETAALRVQNDMVPPSNWPKEVRSIGEAQGFDTSSKVAENKNSAVPKQVCKASALAEARHRAEIDNRAREATELAEAMRGKLWSDIKRSGKKSKPLREFLGDRACVSVVLPTPDGTMVLSGGGSRQFFGGDGDYTPRLIDFSTGLELQKFVGHGAHVSSIAFASDGCTVLTGSYDKTVKLWDVATGRELRNYRINRFVSSVAFDPDDFNAFLVVAEDTAEIFDVVSGRPQQRLDKHARHFLVGAYGSRGPLAISSCNDGSIEVCEVANSRLVSILNNDRKGLVLSAAFTPDCSRLLTGGTKFVGDHYDASVRNGSFDVRLWNVETGHEMRRFTGHTQPVSAVAFAPDGRTVLSGSHDRTMRLWDSATGRELRRYTAHAGAVTSVAFLPDGETAVSGGFFGEILLWDVTP